MNLSSILQNHVHAALLECCSPEFIAAVKATDLLDTVVSCTSGDVTAFAGKDPASRGDAELIVRTYSSFKAVLHYRLAHALVEPRYAKHLPPDADMQAGIISSRGKMLSGAEIHHRCTIGRRFVLDHGFGTVIGETTQMGDDCYVLGGVTMGATGISGNPFGKRHPTLGNRVQVGSFARIFGPVSIGDDVFIGPHCVIKNDLPPNVVVTVKSEIQVTRRCTRPAYEPSPSFAPSSLALLEQPAAR